MVPVVDKQKEDDTEAEFSGFVVILSKIMVQSLNPLCL